MKELIKSILAGQDSISSKRITAMFLILVYVNITYISIWKELSENTIHLVDTIMWAGLILFTGTILEKFKK